MKKIRNLILVKIDSEYCDYLRKYDNRVPYNAGTKELRPFVGILFSIDNYEYFAPLSSPKAKHLKIKNNIDIIKLNNGKLGVINFNNMIPVAKNNYRPLNIDKKPDNLSEKKRIILLKKQLRWLNRHIDDIFDKSTKLYSLYKSNSLPESIT